MSHILIVDDSVTMRQMIAFTLEKVGHTTDQADSGSTGLELFKSASYDLIISDINMPNMGGYEFIKEVRALPQGKRLPILVLTTEGGAGKKAAGRAVGATGWIVKPFEPQALIDVLPRVLGKQAAPVSA